jgi:hypothetical protein
MLIIWMQIAWHALQVNWRAAMQVALDTIGQQLQQMQSSHTASFTDIVDQMNKLASKVVPTACFATQHMSACKIERQRH